MATSLSDLRPTSRYRVFVDETGSRFDDASEAPQRGRLVAIVEGATPLPDLRRLLADPTAFHGVDASDHDNDLLINALHDAQVGVLGIPAGRSPSLPWGDPWVDALFSLLAWVGRLLPLPQEGGVTVEVFVEERGPYAAGLDLSTAGRGLAQRLAAVDPERSARIRWRIQLTHSGQTPELAWADAVAYTWGSSRPASVARLERSGLVGRCLMVDEPAALANSFEPLFRTTPSRPWMDAFSDPSADRPGSLTERWLREAGGPLRQDPAAFARVLDEVTRANDERAIAPTPLIRVVGWLQRWAPADLPPLTEARWLDLQLAAASRRGETAADLQAFSERAAVLHQRLQHEEPRAALGAALRLAELWLNAGEPSRAREVLKPHTEVPPAAYGRLWIARLEAQFGRAALAAGQYTTAIDRFSKAERQLRQLSDPSQRARELAPLLAWKAHAALEAWLDGRIDMNTASEAHLAARKSGLAPVWSALAEARWSACTGAPLVDRTAIPLAAWPGPLVAAWRAIADGDTNAWIPAIDHAFAAGTPAMRWIAAGLDRAAQAAGVPTPERDFRPLPAAAAARLETQASGPLAALRVALPANMR